MKGPPMTARTRLPNRRPAATAEVIWRTADGQHAFTVTAGFDASGTIAEVFYADGQKSGSMLQHTIQDACVVISIALQHGVALADLAHSLGRVPLGDEDAPASPIGAIVDKLAGLAGEIAGAGA